MLKTLLKKQMLEIFRSYFYDSKKNKQRSKASTILYILLFVLIMVGMMSGMFSLLAYALCGPLQSVGDGGILPPVDEQADGCARFAGFSGIRQPFGHPSRPASLVPVVPVKIRQSIFRVHAAVFLACGSVLLRWLPAAGSVGRVSNKGIECLRLKGFDHLQSVSVNNRPFFSAAVFHR